MSAEQDLAEANVKIATLINEVQRFRDASMGLNAIYPTITEGRQAVADGKYFSVPGGGAYMRLYRRQGTSAELIAEFADRSQVQNLVETLGGRGVVGGSGDLMARGAYGIGLRGTPNALLDDTLDGGLHSYSGSTGDPSAPTSSGGGFVVIRHGSTYLVQLIISAETSPRLYVRRSADNGSAWDDPIQLYTKANATVDSNGFLKAASPIFRLANEAESATNEENFIGAGAGAANSEAQGVIANHDSVGVYTITGALGFATEGWTVEVPQDTNGNRLCVVETEQADDDTITVRTFSKRVDAQTGDVVADQPMDIPEGRWVDLRLSMPEPPTSEHPDDAPEPTIPLTPEEEEQKRMEQLERWRASASITPRQARLVLAKHGLLTGVPGVIAAIEDEEQRQVAEIEWEYATSIERSAEWVGVLYGELGLSQEGLDDLFLEGAQL